MFKGRAAPKLIHAVDVKREGLEGKARMFPMIQYQIAFWMNEKERKSTR